MNSRTMLCAGLGAVLMSTAALAASTSSPTTVVAQPVPTQPVPTQPGEPAQPLETSQQLLDRCAALEIQFDQMIPIYANTAAAGPAREMRAAGDAQCKAGDQSDGIEKLRQAVEAIGGTPGA